MRQTRPRRAQALPSLPVKVLCIPSVDPYLLHGPPIVSGSIHGSHRIVFSNIEIAVGATEVKVMPAKANCKVCGNLRTSEDMHPCDRCREPVCCACVVLPGPEDNPDWLCSLSCDGTSHEKLTEPPTV